MFSEGFLFPKIGFLWYNYVLIQEKVNTMLYAHTMYGGGDAKEFTVLTNGKWIKYVDGFPVEDIRLLKSMGTKILGRINFDEFEPQPINYSQRGIDPVLYADYVFENKLLNSIKLNPEVDFWETGNEPVIGSWNSEGDKTIASARWLNNYTVRMCERIAGVGKKAVIGNFSVGTPDLPEHDRLIIWRELLPAINLVASQGGYLGLHEYFSNNTNNDTWLQHRYTWVLPLLKTIPGAKILITEFGADYIVGETAWKDRYRGDVSKYIDDIIPYISRIKQHADVIEGVFLFTFGSDWPNHCVDGVEFPRKWLDAVAKITPPVINPNPVPEPTPEPTPVPVSVPQIKNPGFESLVDGEGWNLRVYATSTESKNPVFRIERGKYGASRLSRYRGDAGAQIFAEWITWKASIYQSLKNVPAGTYDLSAHARIWVREDEVFDKETDHPEVDASWAFIVNDKMSAKITQKDWHQITYRFVHTGGDLTIELYGEVNKFPYNKTAIMFDDVNLSPVSANEKLIVEITENLRLRVGPGTRYNIATVLLPETRFVVRKIEGDWYKVTSDGWINKNYTKRL